MKEYEVGRVRAMKRWVKIITIGVLIIMSLTTLTSCSDYGYNFHFRVVGDNGEITIDNDRLLGKVTLCIEAQWCELECPDNSQIIDLLGGKKGSRELTFVAKPNDGYQVKYWMFNGQIVENNKSNTFTAKVTSDQHYNGVIVVEFESISID